MHICRLNIRMLKRMHVCICVIEIAVCSTLYTIYIYSHCIYLCVGQTFNCEIAKLPKCNFGNFCSNLQICNFCNFAISYKLTRNKKLQKYIIFIYKYIIPITIGESKYIKL